MNFNALNGGNKMKINFEKKQVKAKEMYKIGNVIKDHNGDLFLVVAGEEYGYALVNLTDNLVTKTHETLEGLVNDCWREDDVLVDAEINVF